jgi:dihydrofolate reductase
MTEQPSSRPALVIVAAVAKNRVIGNGNQLAWRLPSDLKRFKAITLGKPIIMGRKTFQSIGKPLPGRANIIVTRDPTFAAGGIETAGSLEAALALAVTRAHEMGAGEIILGGGADLYAQAMPLADRLDITEVNLTPDGDALFPKIDAAIWREISREPGVRTEKDEAGFEVVRYQRKRATAT